MKKLNKRMKSEKLTVESMLCTVLDCKCKCAVCYCKTTSDYGATSYSPSSYIDIANANQNQQLEWQIQAM